MDADEQAAVLAFRLIAAQAARIADGIERKRFWGGEVASGVRQINAALRDVQRYVADDDRCH